MTVSLALPAANAHTPAWTVASYAYIVPAPNPVGVGQQVAIVMWIDTPLPGAAISNDVRRHDYKLTITDPDGKTETQTWDVVSDTTSVQSYLYVPTKAGEYTLKFEYPEQTYEWAGSYQGDIFKAASKTTTLTVQEEPLPAATSSYPLPTEYWTRPIEGQNTDWYSISSNWLGRPYVPGAGASYGMPGGVQLDGTAPNSPHIMWTKPLQFGGVVGGSDLGVPGNTFYTGGSYNVRFSNPLIMYGTLYYQEPYGNSGGGGDYVAVDLRTGEELWRITLEGGVPTFGYLYDYESPNQHGILPNGLLIAASGYGTQTWRGYDPRTGALTSMEITNVPAGNGVPGPHGEYIKYVLTNYGNSSHPNWYLMQWNSSLVIGGGYGFGPANWYSGTVDASTPSCFDWNVSVNLGPGSWSVAGDFLNTAVMASLDDVILLIQGNLGVHPGDFAPGASIPSLGANITAVNLDSSKGAIGNRLWTEYYPPAPGNNTRGIQGFDPEAGVFIFWDKESLELSGYSLANGKEIWRTTNPVNDWMFMPNSVLVAYGKAYWTGYGGVTYCYDVTDGSLLWTYGNGGPGNSTASGLETPWGLYPTFVDVIADGKVYLSTTEHSPNTPLYKDALYRCINATDGTEIWTIMGYATNMYGGTDVVADGFFVFLNCYDMQLYCIGKGPSATTATASPKVSAQGSSVLVEGTVTDIAAGTQQNEPAARFPNGVPAVSDASMNDWMEYVYMQKPRPTDVMGVEVVISVIDPNDNVYEVGRATSDENGMYSVAFTPEVPGKYTIVATFAGTESYWGSYAATAINVEEAPTATPVPTPTPAPMTDTYIVGFGSAMLIAIIIGFVLLLLRKR
jgi:outer membrane protein assembly factor BamB